MTLARASRPSKLRNANTRSSVIGRRSGPRLTQTVEYWFDGPHGQNAGRKEDECPSH
jgi:hypothetical protein